MEEIFDAAVVGGGIAGYTAALALHNFRKKTLFLGASFCDKLSLSSSVQNFPSFSGSGEELKSLIKAQAKENGISFTQGRVDGIYFTGENYLLTQREKSFLARAVVLATGVERKGNLKNEEKFVGKGLSYCAVCDGKLYRDKTIAAVLYGREFEEEANYLAGFAKTVYCFCAYSNPSLKKENILLQKGLPISIEGEKSVESLKIEGGSIKVDGVFLLKNSSPPSALCGGLETENGHIKVNRDLSTNLPGLFAAGDVTGRPYQYIKAAGEGLVAAFSVSEFLSKKS